MESILILLKLLDVIGWPWWLVLAPLWIILALTVVILIAVVALWKKHLRRQYYVK